MSNLGKSNVTIFLEAESLFACSTRNTAVIFSVRNCGSISLLSLSLSLSLFRFRRRRDGRTFVLGEDGKELSKIAASERASGKEGKVVNEWLNGGSELQSGNDGYAMGAPSSSGDFKRSCGLRRILAFSWVCGKKYRVTG